MKTLLNQLTELKKKYVVFGRIVQYLKENGSTYRTDGITRYQIERNNKEVDYIRNGFITIYSKNRIYHIIRFFGVVSCWNEENKRIQIKAKFLEIILKFLEEKTNPGIDFEKIKKAIQEKDAMDLRTTIRNIMNSNK